MPRPPDLLHRLRGQGGMTLIELMVAMFILVVGVMATVAVMDRSRAVGDDTEAREVLTRQAQREIERLSALPWSRLGHPTTPVRSTVAGHPANNITTDSPARYRFDATNTARTEPLVVIGGPSPGQAPANGTQWVDGQSRLQGFYYGYVTQVGTKLRRITVVTTIGAPSKVAPVLLSTLVANPV